MVFSRRNRGYYGETDDGRGSPSNPPQSSSDPPKRNGSSGTDEDSQDLEHPSGSLSPSFDRQLKRAGLWNLCNKDFEAVNLGAQNEAVNLDTQNEFYPGRRHRGQGGRRGGFQGRGYVSNPGSRSGTPKGSPTTSSQHSQATSNTGVPENPPTKPPHRPTTHSLSQSERGSSRRRPTVDPPQDPSKQGQDLDDQPTTTASPSSLPSTSPLLTSQSPESGWRILSKIIVWVFTVPSWFGLCWLSFFFYWDKANIGLIDGLTRSIILVITSTINGALQAAIFKLCLIAYDGKTSVKRTRQMMVIIGGLLLVQQLIRLMVYYFLTDHDLIIQTMFFMVYLLFSPFTYMESDVSIPFHECLFNLEFTAYWIFCLIISSAYYLPRVFQWETRVIASDIFMEYSRPVVMIFLLVLASFVFWSLILLIIARQIGQPEVLKSKRPGNKPLDFQTQLAMACIYMGSGVLLAAADYICYVLAGLLLSSSHLALRIVTTILAIPITVLFNLYFISYADRPRTIMQIQLYQLLFTMFAGLVLFSRAFTLIDLTNYIDIHLCVVTVVLISCRLGAGFLFQNVTICSQDPVDQENVPLTQQEK